MHHASYEQSASGSAYVVVPPRASDVLSRALRDAYRPPEDDTQPFGDLLHALERIDIPPR